jgi:di/tricarboxylate transporter
MQFRATSEDWALAPQRPSATKRPGRPAGSGVNGDQIILFVLLLLVFALLIWGRWRYDLVAFSALVVALIAGVLPLTPIGHKNNAPIMGPGGYRFGDYWRMGLPLELLVMAVAVPMIAVVWPL